MTVSLNRRGFIGALGVGMAAPTQAVKALGLPGGLSSAAALASGNARVVGHAYPPPSSPENSPFRAAATALAERSRQKEDRLYQSSVYRVGVLEPTIAANRSWSPAFALSEQHKRDSIARDELRSISEKLDELWQRIYEDEE